MQIPCSDSDTIFFPKLLLKKSDFEKKKKAQSNCLFNFNYSIWTDTREKINWEFLEGVKIDLISPPHSGSLTLPIPSFPVKHLSSSTT